uniref:DUF4340 domain-containing protein n=1 Tax=uncultured Thiotrichaceae bacterium TaxID=298394 RepID=A0A6S6TGZ9_9GAMM|nr:MAG: Unknown protein [uncultured Thiotrichaceae bacterium]
MKTGIILLAVLLVAQIVLSFVTHSGGTQVAEQSVNGVLLSFDKTKVDQLSVQGVDTKVELKKVDGQWQSADGFPANQSKVSGLLDKLAELKHGLPVGVSEDALTRFKVAIDDYESRVQLKQGDDVLADLYLGSGAGARQSHVRRQADNVVYTTAIGVYDAPTDPAEWLDKTVLQLDEKIVSAVELAELKLEKVSKSKDSAPVWQAAVLPEGKLLNQAGVNEGLQPLWNLQFAEVLGKEAQADYGLDAPVLTLKLTYDGGEREYLFGKMAEGDDFVLKVSDRDEYFRVAGYSVKPMVEKNAMEAWLLAEVVEEVEAEPVVDQEAADKVEAIH